MQTLPARVFAWLLTAAAATSIASAAAAQPRAPQSPATAPGARPARAVVTAARTASPPAIDGRLADEIWRTAARIDKFVQEEPFEGAPATEQTEVLVAYDSEKLYFGIHAHYSDLGLLRANRSDRDKTDDDDTVTVFLEPFLDNLRGYTFAVNGYGVQRDALVIMTTGKDDPAGDLSWNALYSSAGVLVEDGWTAEMAIPIRSLRYPSRPAGQPHQWGFQVRRRILSKDEFDVWSPVSRSIQSFLSQNGILTGLSNLSTRRNLELLPTVTAVQSGRLNSATGAFENSHVEEGGIGLKYGISPQLTFDFTYNPDFSQIESDTQQIDVNQRFPINYPELRPFFLEGQEIYQVPGNVVPVHTRTIVDPRYGAKLTGRIGKAAIGMFLADDQAPGKVDNPADAAYGKSATAVLGRIKYETYRSSYIGAIFTDREFLDGYSRLAGVDASFRIDDTTQFTTRLYRGDRRDLAGNRRVGLAQEHALIKRGRNLGYSFVQADAAPSFANDLSFVRRVDQISNSGNLSYRWWPEGWVINWGPAVNHSRLYDFSHVLQNTDTGSTFNIEFAKQTTFSGSVHRLMERYRGIDFQKLNYTASGTVNMNRKVLFTGSLTIGDEIRFIVNPWLGDSRAYSATVTFRPSSRLQSVLKLTTSRLFDPATDTTAIDVKILRSQTTYQISPRLLIRNITEVNAGVGSNHTLFENILATYRVNSGTVFYVGYDDRYRQGDVGNSPIVSDQAYQRTNRAIFTKLSYLFRTGDGS